MAGNKSGRRKSITTPAYNREDVRKLVVAAKFALQTLEHPGWSHNSAIEKLQAALAAFKETL